MATKSRRKGSKGSRLRLGEAVLSAATQADTRPVKDRLARFTEVHRRYAVAQRKVDAAETELAAAEARVVECDTRQDQAVELLARAVSFVEGRSRRNPFDMFGAPAPSAITRLPFPEAAAAVHDLVVRIRSSKHVSKETLDLAQSAEEGARAVEEALVPVPKLEENVLRTRGVRDALIPEWDDALSALRRGARAAADEGAPNLHATLFPRVVRSSTKKKEPEQQQAQQQPAAEQQPQQPAATETSNAA